MNRRTFLRRASIVASGAVAADQLELLDRLGWVRRLFPSAGLPNTSRAGNTFVVAQPYGIVTNADWSRLLREDYIDQSLVELANAWRPDLSRANRTCHREAENRDAAIQGSGPMMLNSSATHALREHSFAGRGNSREIRVANA